MLRILDRPAIRYMFYAGFGLVCFLLSLALTFPDERVKQILEVQLEANLGYKYKVRIADLDLWRLSGVQLEGVMLEERWTDAQFADANRGLGKNDPPVKPPQITIPRLGGRLAPLSSIINLAPTVAYIADFERGGAVEGTLSYGSDIKVHAELDDLDMLRSKLLLSLTGIPAFGTMVGTVDLTISKKTRTPTAGTFKLKGKKLTLGPGTIKPRPMTFIQIPSTNFGNLTFDAEITSKKGASPTFAFKKFEAKGRDIRMEAWGNIALNRVLGRSRFDVSMRLQLDQGFIKEHNLAQLLTAQYFRDGKGKEGWYGFELKGPIKQRSFRGSRRASLGQGAPSRSANTPKKSRVGRGSKTTKSSGIKTFKRPTLKPKTTKKPTAPKK